MVGAHEQSMAAAEEASKALHSGGVPEDTPGMGDAVGACLFQCCLAATCYSHSYLRRSGVDAGMHYNEVSCHCRLPAAEVSVHLPTARDWQAALHPQAVEPAPQHIVTTCVDPETKLGAAQWPGQGLQVAPADEQGTAWPPKVGQPPRLAHVMQCPPLTTVCLASELRTACAATLLPLHCLPITSCR